MNKTITSIAIGLAVITGGSVIMYNNDTPITIQLGDIEIADVAFEIEDDGTSDVDILPVAITGISILNQEKYTYNDLVSLSVMYSARSGMYDQINKLIVDKVAELLKAELEKLPERTDVIE